MTDTGHGVALVRAPQSSKRKLLRLGIAGLLATSALCAASAAQARTTQIQILTRGTPSAAIRLPASANMSSSRGLRPARSTRSNPQNAVITDIQLAPRNTERQCRLSAQFLHFEAAGSQQGQPQDDVRAAESRGKTYQTLNNTPNGTNDPAALTDPTVLDDSFLWTQGYTTVWSGWENNLGPLNGLDGDGVIADRASDPATPTSLVRDTSTS